MNSAQCLQAAVRPLCLAVLVASIAGCASQADTISVPASTGLPSPLALSCLSCHSGPDQNRQARDLSRLAASEIADALRAWRDHDRDGTVMPRLARALDDAEIDRLAAELGAMR